MIERWLPTYGDRVASVVEQFAERRATFSSPGLLAIDSVEGLVEKEAKRTQKVAPPRRLEGVKPSLGYRGLYDLVRLRKTADPGVSVIAEGAKYRST